MVKTITKLDGFRWWTVLGINVMITYNPTRPMCVGIHKKVFFLPKRVGKVMRWVCDLPPQFYAIGLRDCDSGGRVFAWEFDWILSGHRWQHLEHKWNGCGDGEVYNRITLRQYLNEKRRRKDNAIS